MDVATYERIKSKIETLKAKKAKIEGALENEALLWEKQFSVSTIEDMEKLYNEAEENAEMYSTKCSTLFEELKGLTNWALL